ncbi:MAG TPA: hypothetical protein VM241_03220 [Candidatus Thermoplasmatota archaeon]|nr:hypothetical protein [Candidatus Thermoplasmatota archaeon]
MSWRLLAVAALVTAGLAGCISQPSTPTDATGAVNAVTGLLKAGPALWNDPQNTPHPKFGWATLSSPPSGASVPTWWKPIAAVDLPAHIAGIQQLVNVGGNVTKGSGISLFGSVAVVPDDSEFAHFVDISDPTHPKQLGQIESAGRGAAVIAFPGGRLVTAIATSPGFDVIEFTDPTHPVMLNQTVIPQGGHKLGIVPGTPILYNAASNGGGTTPAIGPDPCNADIKRCTGITEIYDLSDPAHPLLVQNFQNGLSCHHIFFWNAPDGSKQRAICAGIQYTQLWDTADPLHPKVIVSLPVHAGDPRAPSTSLSVEAFSHSAGINIKGNVLYVGDESGGGGVPPGCLASVNVPVLGAASVPVGATWFYDISTETAPRLLGWYSPGIGATTYASPGVPNPTDPTSAVNLHSTSCTTHHGRVVPDKEGRDLLAMSYYGDGVILLDFTGIAAGTLPKVVGQFAQDSNTWETAYYGGYLFTGDLARGMDILGFK